MKKELVKRAFSVAEKAYAPYSKFTVGASLLCKNGKIYDGCNVENASYGATICAERSAFASAISGGEREFEAIAIVGKKQGAKMDFCSPCGICRQFMTEFCDKDFRIYLSDGSDIKEYTLGELIPLSFDLEV